MTNKKRSMPICFSTEQIKILEDYAKKRGMTNTSQAVESIISSAFKN